MTVPSYTEEDVEMVAQILIQWESMTPSSGGYPDYARRILAALSSSGRLLPPGSGETAECGCPIRYAVMRIEEETKECSTRKAAERLAKYIDEEYSG